MVRHEGAPSTGCHRFSLPVPYFVLSVNEVLFLSAPDHRNRRGGGGSGLILLLFSEHVHKWIIYDYHKISGYCIYQKQLWNQSLLWRKRWNDTWMSKPQDNQVTVQLDVKFVCSFFYSLTCIYKNHGYFSFDAKNSVVTTGNLTNSWLPNTSRTLYCTQL